MLLGPSQKRKRVSELLLSLANNLISRMEVWGGGLGLLLPWDLQKLA